MRFEQPSKLAMAHLAMGETTTYLGEFHSARGHLERAIELGSRHHGIKQGKPFLAVVGMKGVR